MSWYLVRHRDNLNFTSVILIRPYNVVSVDYAAGPLVAEWVQPYSK